MEYTALISYEAEVYAKALEHDFDVLRLPSDDRLDIPVASHADMNVFLFGESAILSSRYAERFPYVADHLREVCSLKVLLSEREISREYPNDVMLNVLICGNTAFSLEKYTCSEVKEVLLRERIKLINIRQGYAACNALAFGNRLITADRSILKAAVDAGIEVLEISRGGISLPGYNEGFIGGASGVCGNTVFFTGNVKLHPDGEKILRFVQKGGFEVVCLSSGELYDVGGIKFIKNVRSRK